MTEEELKTRLDAQDKVLASTRKDIQSIKNYFKWMFIGTVATFIIPLIAAVIIVPIVIGKYMQTLDGLF